ncbi:hypothetical protein H0B56_14260 [Haloechinothrix sp. YIM 98757]|uniref:PE family protein n=1 Tax=Haloechinothrix aidingensis TaxID=2752311 RepID=A0A838ABS0_9PSEU|nr:hypothetical protein [Haloechinothrix aidingensis]MBA0126712.1 hypothetical protein [Haloechinothrix aidingensis]
MADEEDSGAPPLPLPQVDDAPMPVGPQQVRAQADAKAQAAGLEDIAFDSEGVDKVIKRLKDVLSSLREAQRQSEPLRNIAKKSDPVTNSYADTANEGGAAYQACLRKEIAALDGLIEDAKAMKEERLQHEDEVAAGLKGQD